MTDDTAVEKCAWCGKVPIDNDSPVFLSYYCPDTTKTCLGYDYRKAALSVWNARQLAIMAQRRKDFDAGKFCANSAVLFDDYLRSQKSDE